ILGRSRLQEIWDDMEKTTLPSWCTPAPPRIGDKGQGKISADGWRVFCTVHLVVTLGRLWGRLPPDSRENQLLKNFCELIAATKIAAGRRITVARSEEFRDLMLRYLRGLHELFPAHQLIPYHHISIHLTELLCHFGPTTAWRCWVFERYNHMLQNIESNGRFGELEKTLFERMCMIQRLRGLISSFEQLGHRLQPLADRLGDYLNPTVKGTVFEDLTGADAQWDTLQGEECWLEQEVLRYLTELFVRTGKAFYESTTTPGKAKQYDKFSHRGAIFSPSSFSIRDSHVVIVDRISGDWHAGKIKQIFTVPFRPSSEAYFVVQRFKEFSAQEAQRDPYRRYPLVGGRLYHPELEDEIEVVAAQEVIAHFARTPYDGQAFGIPCFHALPLDRVPPTSYQTDKADFF
ncbi:hypothetical protein EDB89DRAFT_1849493, partial [Lactarius sanguifluus]